MRLRMHPKDFEAYQDWLDKHKNCDALVADTRTHYIIKAEYHCPQSMTLTEQLNIWEKLAQLGEINE